MAWQKTRFDLPDDLPPSVREAIGRDILQRIQERAINENKGHNPETGRDKKFPGYSKEYAKAKGSSRGDVDLVLSGDMFSEMDILSHKKGSVLIGFKNGTESNSKAEGNQVGSYGKSPDPSKARPFLGLTKKDLDEIVRRHVA